MAMSAQLARGQRSSGTLTGTLSGYFFLIFSPSFFLYSNGWSSLYWNFMMRHLRAGHRSPTVTYDSANPTTPAQLTQAEPSGAQLRAVLLRDVTATRPPLPPPPPLQRGAGACSRGARCPRACVCGGRLSLRWVAARFGFFFLW